MILMRMCRPGSRVSVALILRALCLAMLTPCGSGEDLDGTSTYVSLSAADLTQAGPHPRRPWATMALIAKMRSAVFILFPGSNTLNT